MELIPHVIDGAYTESADGARFESVDPGRGLVDVGRGATGCSRE